jgi:hypothetical protein
MVRVTGNALSYSASRSSGLLKQQFDVHRHSRFSENKVSGWQ